MRTIKSILIIFSVFILVLAAILLIWANWPPSESTRTIKLHLIAPTDWGSKDVEKIESQAFLLTLSYPETIKTGQTAHYQINIEKLPAVISVGDTEYQLRVRCELILPGFDNQQAGMSIQSIQEQVPARFAWDLHALSPRKGEGMLRLFVDYVSADNTVIPQLISVTELYLKSVSLVGLSITQATSLAVALVLLAGLAGGLGLTRPHYK